MNVIIRPQFYLDVEEEVYWLLTNADASVAQRWHSSVWETIERLKTHPLIGRERKDLRQSGIRSWRVNRFVRWLIFTKRKEGRSSFIVFVPVSWIYRQSKYGFDSRQSS